jgi:prepilin-type N-terminal cleavage/methylation domain-containing protein
MKVRFPSSEKGLTLVELLVGLAILGIVSGMIISTLIGAMNSFKNVNNQVSLQDEANYIMTQFVNTIFIATKVEEVESSGCNYVIKVTNRENISTTLGFKDNKAVMNGESIQADALSIVCAESKITINQDDKTVSIKMAITDESGKKVNLTNNVSFVEVK